MKVKKPVVNIILGLEAEKLIGLRGPKAIYAKDLGDAIKFRNALKKPVVLKIISSGAVHKSDIGGVSVARNEKELADSFLDMQNIIKRKKLRDAKIVIQEFIAGHEAIIGIKNDPTFGHVIMFGIGGKYVEIINDVSFMACPISEKDAESMIGQLRFRPLLEGAFTIPASKKSIIKALVHVSHLAIQKNIQELDINPLIVDNKCAYVADARVIM